jgi:hypothetical protein
MHNLPYEVAPVFLGDEDEYEYEYESLMGTPQ